MTDEQQRQPYDSSLKALVQEQAAEILPNFLPGAIFEQTLDIEIIRPTMRADKVYRVQYREQPHILHLEFESGADSDMAPRLLTYHAVIFQDHHLPVTALIVYLFRTSMAESPLQEISGQEELLTFHFRVLPLWKLDAGQYVQRHVVSMYVLLPTMQGADATLLLRAIDEMAERYKDNEPKLARQLVWLGILLRRADTVTPEDKRKIQERLDMFDNLWEQDPKIQKLQSEKKAEGIIEGEILGLQEAVVEFVEARFPDLAELAQQRVSQISNLDDLNRLVKLIATTPDEDTANWILSRLAA
jgi:hypothetical protein